MLVKRAIAMTSPGPGRTTNEDATLCMPALGLCGVADGMGGPTAAPTALGEVERRAHWLARIRKDALTDPSVARRAMTRFLQDCFHHASERVTEVGNEEDNPLASTTLTIAAVVGETAFVAHVGNSRAWLWRRGELHQLTRDHTVATLQAERGTDTGDEESRRGFSRKLLQSVGRSPNLDLDLGAVQLEADDILMLTSDGVHLELTGEHLGGLLGRGDLDESAANVLDAVHLVAGRDDASVVLLQVASGSSQAGRHGGVLPEVADVAFVMGSIRLFEALPLPERLIIALYMAGHSFAAGDRLFDEGDDARGCYFVLAGRLMVTRGGVDIARLGPGDQVGMQSLLDDHPRRATVSALDASRVLSMSNDGYRDLCQQHPELGLRLTQAVLSVTGERLESMLDRIARIHEIVQGNLNIDLGEIDLGEPGKEDS